MVTMVESYPRQDGTKDGNSSAKAKYHHGDLRSALIAAADGLLEERGVAGFAVAECARRAGVSKAAPAHHFGNVSGLLGTIATMGVDDLADRMEGALVGAEPFPAARLRAIAAAYVDFALDRPERFRLMFGPSPPSDARGEPLTRSTDRALQILEREVAALRSDQRQGRSLTVFTWSFVHGLAMLLLDHRLSMLMDRDDAEQRNALVDDAVALLDF